MFNYLHCRKVCPEVALPQVIRTVEHKAWQVPGFPVPKVLVLILVDLLKLRLKHGILEYCDRLYHNPWFLSKKKGGKNYWLINTVIKINKHMI